MVRLLSQHHLPVGVEADEDKQHNAKGQQGCAAIADEGQGDADHGGKAHGHTDVDDDVEEKYAGDPIGITSAEDASLSFGDCHDTHQQNDIDAEKEYAAQEAEALPDRTKNEVGLLFGHKVIAGLRAFEQAFSDEAAAAYGYLTLFYIIIVIAFFSNFLLLILQHCLGGLVLRDIVFTDGVIDTFYLVRLEDMIKGKGDDESLDAYAYKPDTHDEKQYGTIAFDRLAQNVDREHGDTRKDKCQGIGLEQQGGDDEYGKGKADDEHRCGQPLAEHDEEKEK